MGEVWGLFAELATLSQGEVVTGRNWDYSHTLEIINSALNNNISKENFDLRAYEIACAKTDDIELSNMRKKYLSIVDTAGDSEDSLAGYGEISMNDGRLKVVEEAFELFENNEEFEDCLAELFSIRNKYIIQKGIDPVKMLGNALEGIPEAISSFKEIALKDSRLADMLEVLCSSNNLKARLELSV